MKRSAALIALSREHHQALVVAQKLRRADDAREAAASFLDFWREEGRHHFRVEEEVLLPMWGLLGEIDETGVERLAREHRSIRTKALALTADSPSLEQVRSLGEELAAHVRFEERELFPAIESDLGPDGLAELARAVSEAEKRPQN